MQLIPSTMSKDLLYSIVLRYLLGRDRCLCVRMYVVVCKYMCCRVHCPVSSEGICVLKDYNNIQFLEG